LRSQRARSLRRQALQRSSATGLRFALHGRQRAPGGFSGVGCLRSRSPHAGGESAVGSSIDARRRRPVSALLKCWQSALRRCPSACGQLGDARPSRPINQEAT
jgi:hypothetical protein